MFSSLVSVLASLKFAEPVTTIGSSESGSTSMNLRWIQWTLTWSVMRSISPSHRSKPFSGIRLPIAITTFGSA